MGGALAMLLVAVLLAWAAWQRWHGDESVPGENETGFWLVASAAVFQGAVVVALCASVGAVAGAVVPGVKGPRRP